MTSTLLLTLCLATLQAQAQAPHYTLGDLEQRALAAHPALAVAQAESQAIKQAAEPGRRAAQSRRRLSG